MASSFLKTLGLGLALAAAPVALAYAAENAPAAPSADANAHMGTFVSAAGTEFTMKDNDGKEHKHTLAADAKVTNPNGEPCKIADLKAGQKIKVTTKDGDAKTAVKVESIV
jgi:hypothetical protein